MRTREKEAVDTVVAGGGVVGLAIAKALAEDGREVLLLEAEERTGSVTSSRNSGVIHAGLYYPTGSLKARLCVRGKHLLYDFCAAHGVAHRRCGKLVVAAGMSEITALEALQAKAVDNDVTDLTILDAHQVRALEPDVSAVAAILSPSSGIVDQHELMLAIEGVLENRGGIIVPRAPVVDGRVTGEGIELTVGGASDMRLKAKRFVNAAGLGAQGLAGVITGHPHLDIPPLYYAKGHYFSLSGKSPFSRLIYPLPVDGSLGLHAGLDMSGQIRFGPDIEWVDAPDYSVPDSLRDKFAVSIRRYWPAVDPDRLSPDYAGIRPKLVPKGVPNADFCILGPEDHGAGGVVHLFGIESPGLTSSLAIGEYVAALLGD
ncbi:NAD(P)/FAD-dependent oxidoreductase [Eilatimonas milleporae]|uniref:L-2-hydroxyglutarate oxidase LhgO n=1 Tax=Eilatimonas milleporae TaxID=911205 RepID=A0A3M0CQB8_9PROT|nr:NAD(P)/FAD-dependent oxidoreductase [Eilatimonas milleporae]RMB11751.1 L-2-hydroxyglutarate oxidase LhgO [Eilatimonas milleporae]